MSILSTVLKAKIKKQPIMVVSFDASYGFPEAKTRYCSKEQFSDAALFLMGKSHEYSKNSTVKPALIPIKKAQHKKIPKKRIKKEGNIHKFFRILFTRERVAEFPASHQAL